MSNVYKIFICLFWFSWRCGYCNRRSNILGNTTFHCSSFQIFLYSWCENSHKMCCEFKYCCDQSLCHSLTGQSHSHCDEHWLFVALHVQSSWYVETLSITFFVCEITILNVFSDAVYYDGKVHPLEEIDTRNKTWRQLHKFVCIASDATVVSKFTHTHTHYQIITQSNDFDSQFFSIKYKYNWKDFFLICNCCRNIFSFFDDVINV